MSHSVLIIEDESFLAELYASELKEHGVTAVIAPDGTTALDLLSRKKFSVILLDILLPDMNGIDLMQQAVKHLAKVPPVIVLSNLGKEFPKEIWKSLNMKAHLVKSDVLAGAIWNEISQYLR